jgi:hypothetical protein
MAALSVKSSAAHRRHVASGENGGNGVKQRSGGK